MSKSHNGNIANASGATAQWLEGPYNQICVGKLCFYGQLGPGLQPERDCFKIGPVEVQLLSAKVSYLQYLSCFGPRRRNSLPQKRDLLGQAVFFLVHGVQDYHQKKIAWRLDPLERSYQCLKLRSAQRWGVLWGTPWPGLLLGQFTASAVIFLDFTIKGKLEINKQRVGIHII